MVNEEESCFPRGRPTKPADDSGVKRKERARSDTSKDSLFGKVSLS